MNDDHDPAAPGAMTPAHWAVPALNASDLAERINGLYAATWQIVRQSEAQLMEMLWELRHKHFREEDISPTETRAPDQCFQAFVKARIPWLPPADAQRMVDTWDAARKDRGLLEFARAKPGEAMRFFPVLAAAGGADAFPGDEDVAEILAMPPKKRNKKLRELIDAADGDGKRRPDDEELIKSLRAERDELAAARQAGQDRDACFNALTKYLDKLNELAADLRLKASVETSEFLAVYGPGLKEHHPRLLQSRIDSIRGIASALEADGAHLLEQWLHFDLWDKQDADSGGGD